MATTRLTDVVVPQVFQRYMSVDTAEKSSIFRSGIMRNDANAANFLAGGGTTVNMPFWKDLTRTAPGIANDDPSSIATPMKISTGQAIAIRNIRTAAWSSADLVSELAGSDPMAQIRTRIGDYWVDAFEDHLISTLIGVFADNAANDAGDMRSVIGTDAAGAPADTQYISSEAIIDAKQTMGDAARALSVIIMHSVCHSRLQKANLIDYIPDSEGKIEFGTYLGYRVVESDQVRVVQGTTNTARYLYSTYIVGAGAIGWAESPPDIPVEVDREPLQGNGMGVETLVTRRQYVMHPYGFKFTSSSLAASFPTNAELQTTANWDRVYPERKQIPLVELVTNG